MDNPNFIFFHWKKEQKVLEKNLGILKQHSDTNAVHDLRVAIKKLRAILKLYILIKQEPEWQYLLKNTELLFAVLGKQRDVEICLGLVTTYEKETNCRYAELKLYLQSLLKKTQYWSKRALHQYRKKELTKTAFLLQLDEELQEKEQVIQKILLILHSHLADIKKYFRQPHKVRQHLKEIYYWINIIPDDPRLQAYHKKELHIILDDFGNWQDQEILLTIMKHFRKDYLPRSFPEYDSMKTLENIVKEKKESLLKTTIPKTRRLLKKISAAQKKQVISVVDIEFNPESSPTDII